MITITNLQTGETIPIKRDVTAIHPAWVHDQCGTTSEIVLQMSLYILNVEWWYDGEKHLGQDKCGIQMFRD